jgi:DNA-cytosine methyltransferase
MVILDLFSGIGGFAKAFEDIFGDEHQHYYSDVDKYALAVYKYQFPNAIALGDVTQIDVSKLPQIDFMFAGFPCQNLSIAGNRLGLEGAKSGLFYNTVELWKQVKPKYWIFENVASMKKEEKQKITDILGVEAIMLNSSLVSGQNRKRYFWTNIPNITQPEDRHIYLKDILESGEGDRLKSYWLDASYYKGTNLEQYLNKSRRQIVFEKPNKLCHINKSDSQGNRVYDESGKSVTLASQSGGLGAKTGLYRVALRNRGGGKKPEVGYDNKANSLTTVQSDSMVMEASTFSLSNSRQDLSITADNKSNCLTSTFRGSPDGNGRPGVIIPEQYVIRKLTPVECCRLQTFDDSWNSKGIFETKNGLEVKDISNSQRYKQCGNAVTVEVIKHILKHVII